MSHEYVLNYSTKILRSAAVTFFKHLIGPLFPLILIAITAYVCVRIYAGDRSWSVGAASAVVFVVITIILSLFIAHIKHAKKTALELEGGITTLIVSEAGVRFQSSLGLVEIPWSSISIVRECKTFLLLQFKKGGYTSIPLASLDAEGINYIKKTTIGAGGKIA